MVNGTSLNPLLEEIEAIGPCTIRAITDDVPPLEVIDPEVSYSRLGSRYRLRQQPSSAIGRRVLFVRDGMELSVEELTESAPAAGVEIALDAPKTRSSRHRS